MRYLPPHQQPTMHLGIRSVCLLYLSSPSAAFLVPAATSASNGKACWRSDQHSDGKIRFSILTALAPQNEKQGGQANIEGEEASSDGIAESGVFLHGFEADLDQKMDDLKAQYEEYKEFSGSSAGRIDNKVKSKVDDGSKDDETETPAITSTDPNARGSYGYVTTGDRQLTAAQLEVSFLVPRELCAFALFFLEISPSSSQEIHIILFLLFLWFARDEEYPAPYYTPPPNFFALATNQFVRNLDSMLGRNKATTSKGDETVDLRAKLNSLKLPSWDLESIARCDKRASRSSITLPLALSSHRPCL